jgi:hypothetical protein
MRVVIDHGPAVPGEPIYEHLRRHVDLSGRVPEDLGLPDDEKVMGGRIRWVPGAMDGIFSHHAGASESQERAGEVVDLLLQACRRRSARTLRKLYARVLQDDALGYLDALIERLVAARPDRQRLHDVALWLCMTSPDRGPVKLGVALLGVAGIGSDVGVVRTLGAHEEFTLYCAVALSNGLPDPESELWALAASVDGWGRIQCVERLRGTTDPDIRSWILREGYRNSIMNEYLAYIAATTGGLLAALHAEAVDRGLLTAAGQILQALIEGGPAEDIDDYEAGADAVEAFLALMRTRAETLDDYQAVAAIRSFLSRDEGWDERSVHGWTATRRQAFEDACQQVLSSPSWDERIAVAMASDDRATFWLAERIARLRGWDTFDVLLSRLRADAFDSCWFNAWEQADGERAEQLVQVARSSLPLEEITGGPADELGQGPGWRVHFTLDWTLQALREHPGVGADLILVGLGSPVVRNRNLALMALKHWPRDTWPATASDLVTDLALRDPNEHAKALAAELSAQVATGPAPDAARDE